MEQVQIVVADSPPLLDEAKSVPVPLRDKKGTYLAGVSGNPRGRAVGSKNKATIIKSYIEDGLSTKLSRDAIAIMQKAINMAKDGDRTMIKLLLGDMLSATRSGEKDGGNGPTTVNVEITNYTGTKPRSPLTFEAN